jgi:non-SMC mitotic condensation complex subunit 1
MGCIRVDKMVDYLGEPLRKTLKDESPYVRKTAVICVAKLFDLNPAMCVENGFLEMLQEIVNDANPMVLPPIVSPWRFLCTSFVVSCMAMTDLGRSWRMLFRRWGRFKRLHLS